MGSFLCVVDGLGFNQVGSTWVNGNLVFDQGKWDLTRTGEAI